MSALNGFVVIECSIGLGPTPAFEHSKQSAAYDGRNANTEVPHRYIGEAPRKLIRQFFKWRIRGIICGNQKGHANGKNDEAEDLVSLHLNSPILNLRAMVGFSNRTTHCDLSRPLMPPKPER